MTHKEEKLEVSPNVTIHAITDVYNLEELTVIEEMAKALEAAQQFIRNGVEYGYIRLPDKDTPDTAHETPGMIEQALTRYESEKGERVWVDGKDIVHPMWVCRTCPVPECDMAGEDKFASCRTFPAIWGPKQVKRCRELRLAYLQRKDGE